MVFAGPFPRSVGLRERPKEQIKLFEDVAKPDATKAFEATTVGSTAVARRRSVWLSLPP